jgi:UDP-N-acetylmuramoyl-tripeptide--D-alanyl-D-alanine ligase
MTSVLWTSLETAVITGGKNTREWQATGVCINAQELKPGDLFFAAPDDNLDDVFMKGAAAAVVASGVEDKGWPLMRVVDVFDALQTMARAARFKTHAQVVAVQGQAGRQAIQQILSSVFDVFSGGRHLSLGLTALPEICDFAVFGFSPLVKPDIAVVTDCSNVDGSVFESMQPNGRVLIHADSGNVAAVIAKARAAGIRNIFTYGRAVDADAVMVENLHAANGVRLRMRILGETVDTVLPANESATPEMLAAALILKLSEISAVRIEGVFAGHDPASIQGTNLALIDRMLKNPSQAAFKVVNMIDTGNGRRKVVLDNITVAPQQTSMFANKDLEIPLKVDNLELVYACKGVSLFSNAEKAVQQIRPLDALGKIVPSVLSPGDFLTFKGLGGKGLRAKGLLDTPKNLISGALRLMPQAGRKV